MSGNNSAAIVPYLGGRCAIVIAEGDVAPLRVIAARSLDVGRLVDLPPEQATRRHAKRREITITDILGAAETVTALLVEHGVSALVVEAVTGSGVFARYEADIGDEIVAQAGDLGIAVSRAARVPADAVALHGSLQPWPPAEDTQALRHAAALLLATRGVVLARAVVARPPSVPPPPSSRRSRPPPPPPAPALAPPAEFPAGTRRILVDPGSGYVGVLVAVGDVAPLHVAYLATVRVDSKDWPGIEACAEEVARVALAHGTTMAVVERASHLYLPGGESAGGHAARGTRILRSGEVGAAISVLLMGKGIKVLRPSAGRVRSAITSRAVKGEARINAVGEAVRAGYVDWPGSTDDAHQRDVGALGLWAALPPPPPKAPRAPRGTPAAPGERAPRDRRGRRRPALAAAQDQERQIRADAGCSCARKHRRECPLFVPLAARKAVATSS